VFFSFREAKIEIQCEELAVVSGTAAPIDVILIYISFNYFLSFCTVAATGYRLQALSHNKMALRNITRISNFVFLTGTSILEDHFTDQHCPIDLIPCDFWL
jgi:hypothetical protein